MGPNVQGCFDALHAQLDEVIGRDLPVEVYQAAAADFPKPRDFAYCHTALVDGVWLIGTAPKLEHAESNRVIALLAHEFAHALLLDQGATEHTEREADEMAETLFDLPISYDVEDVQTIGDGVRPRPPYLPA